MSPQERLERLRLGADPTYITTLNSGFVVLGETQYLRGYCLLLAHPFVDQLNSLESKKRIQFLADMAALGDAVQQVTRCKRINYGIYGNLDPFLHAHVWPRFSDEDPSRSALPPLSFDPAFRGKPEFAFSPDKHQTLQNSIREALNSR